MAISGVNSASSTSTETYDPSTGTWTPSASMLTPRISFGATVLSDGKLLVAGGTDGGAYMSVAELYYDSTADTWSPTNSLHDPRSGFGSHYGSPQVTPRRNVSRSSRIVGTGVWYPPADNPLGAPVRPPDPASDHVLVWLDPTGPRSVISAQLSRSIHGTLHAVPPADNGVRRWLAAPRVVACYLCGWSACACRFPLLSFCSGTVRTTLAGFDAWKIFSAVWSLVPGSPASISVNSTVYPDVPL